jgi:hypothetical protein
MPVTLGVPNILTDPGYLLWAPIGSAEPANTVVGSVFTDTWPVAWINQGATEEGSEFEYEIKVEPISVAEFFDPIRYATTDRSGSFAFNLADYTLKNLSRAYNAGGAVTTVSGAGTTLLSKLQPPAPGNEVRAMIGWESLDRTMRIVCYQTLNGGAIKSAYKRAPSKAVIPCKFMMEMPAGASLPFSVYTAGTARLGV